MKPENYKLNIKKNDFNALYDMQVSHNDFRIYSHVLKMEEYKINWRAKTWKQIGIELGDMYRSTISKTFIRLAELGYFVKIDQE